jgi:hypothetical protein
VVVAEDIPKSVVDSVPGSGSIQELLECVGGQYLILQESRPDFTGELPRMRK